MNFVAIYKTGDYVIKSTVHHAFSLPGEYYVFSLPNHFNDDTFNTQNGVCYYEQAEKTTLLRIQNLELIDLKRTTNDSVEYTLYDYNHNRPKRKYIRLPHISYASALKDIVTLMINASTYPNLEEFDRIQTLEKDIKDLQIKLNEIQKENNELRSKL